MKQKAAIKEEDAINTISEKLAHERREKKKCSDRLLLASNELALKDVGKEKRKSERIKIINDLVQRNKDLEQFSYIVSHNLRAPVANILGLVSVLQTSGLNKKEETKVVSFLGTAARNLDSVIKDLNTILDLKHTFNEKREIVLFDDLLKQVKFSLDNVINSKIVSITGDFAAMKGMVTLKSYLYSIFLNLIRNSIKYKRAGVKSIIKITSSMVDDKIQVLFTDNGMGIDLDLNGNKLFGLYNRFHSHVEGKGMGLYMVKTQVEALGGHISVSSQVDKGTAFIISFDFS